MKIASVISYSSYHNPFIEKVIEEAYKATGYVVIVSHDHFYDGTKDEELKTDLIGDGKPARYGIQKIIKWEPGQPARYHHNQLRKIGWDLLRVTSNNLFLKEEEIDTVMFIDSDEVLEGDRVKEWLETIEPNTDHSLPCSSNF